LKFTELGFTGDEKRLCISLNNSIVLNVLLSCCTRMARPYVCSMLVLFRTLQTGLKKGLGHYSELHVLVVWKCVHRKLTC